MDSTIFAIIVLAAVLLASRAWKRRLDRIELERIKLRKRQEVERWITNYNIFAAGVQRGKQSQQLQAQPAQQKPECQSCSHFISCAMNKVTKCPLLTCEHCGHKPCGCGG